MKCEVCGKHGIRGRVANSISSFYCRYCLPKWQIECVDWHDLPETIAPRTRLEFIKAESRPYDVINFLDWLPVDRKSELPNVIAVYFLVTQNKLIYIGTARSLSIRCGGSFSGHHHYQKLNQDEYDDLKIGWLQFNTIEDAIDAEYILIGLFRPKFNRQSNLQPICPPQNLDYWKQKLLPD